MPFVLQSMIYRADLQANPSALYVFGDNQARVGLGGQAGQMRGEPNAVGVATLHSPGVWWRDGTVVENVATIDADMAPLFAALAAGRVVVFPLDGIGTGLANLENSSPLTWAHLKKRVAELGQWVELHDKG